MLTGQAKKDYQREYMRKRQGTKRPRVGLISPERSNNTFPSGSNKPEQRSNKPEQRSNKDKVRRELEKAGLKLDGNRISNALQSISSPMKRESNTRIPWYNPLNPQIGERVRMASGEIVLVPELDADGEPMEGGTTGRLVSGNIFKPSFTPSPKLVKVKKGRRW